MLKLKEFLEVIDENTYCKITDINGKMLLSPSDIIEIAQNNMDYLDYHILHCFIDCNYLYIILDVDVRK
jgi:hypothetical protein